MIQYNFISTVHYCNLRVYTQPSVSHFSALFSVLVTELASYCGSNLYTTCHALMYYMYIYMYVRRLVELQPQ